MIAALFVATGGCYFGIDNVDPWDEARDARLYAGPWPVVAHPPCERYGRWSGPNVGDDGGCFFAAVAAVQRFGGLLEHPAHSKAWELFSLPVPLGKGGWCGDSVRGWSCQVEQGNYGHRARKATWLYAAHVNLSPLIWGPSSAVIGPRPGRDPIRERRIGAVQRMCRKERRATPPEFRDLLISIARSARR